MMTWWLINIDIAKEYLVLLETAQWTTFGLTQHTSSILDECYMRQHQWWHCWVCSLCNYQFAQFDSSTVLWQVVAFLSKSTNIIFEIYGTIQKGPKGLEFIGYAECGSSTCSPRLCDKNQNRLTQCQIRTERNELERLARFPDVNTWK